MGDVERAREIATTQRSRIQPDGAVAAVLTALPGEKPDWG
jgi:hypothetical protein